MFRGICCATCPFNRNRIMAVLSERVALMEGAGKVRTSTHHVKNDWLQQAEQ